MFSILCPALCGVALADDLHVPALPQLVSQVGDLAENNASFSVRSLDSDGAVVSSMNLESGSDISIVTNIPIHYGVSGAQSDILMPGTYQFPYSSSGWYEVKRFSLPASTDGLYFMWDSDLVVDFVFPITANYPDVESVDVYGALNCFLFVGGASYMTTQPSSVSLLVGDSVVASGLTPTADLDYSYTIGRGEFVSSITIRCFYPAGFDLKATSESSAIRNLQFSIGRVDDTPVNSTSGWFNRLFAWLSDIREGIRGVASGISSGFTNVVNSIIALPQKIADAVKGLFVPTDAQLDELKASFNTLLSEKLGFVYQAGSLVTGVFDAVFDAVDNPESDVSFVVPAFPAFNVDGTDVSLWEDSIVVDIADNDVVQTVQQVASPFVIAVMVWGFVHSMEDAFLAFVGGKSLSDWVRDRKGEKE